SSGKGDCPQIYRQVSARHGNLGPRQSSLLARALAACFHRHLPLWAAFPIATVNVILCYLPSHEAQHSNFGRPGDRLWWLNELIGYVSTIPLVLPFKIARLTHLEHHRHTNDPDLDPDYGAHAATWWQAIMTGIKRRQPGQPNSY